MSLVKVTGTKFVRDTKTMGLSNQDSQERNEYFSKVRLLNKQKTELSILHSEIDVLKNDMQEIKTLLITLLQSR